MLICILFSCDKESFLLIIYEFKGVGALRNLEEATVLGYGRPKESCGI